MFIFRWILGILKMFLTVLVLAAAIRLAFTYLPGLFPFNLVQEDVKERADIESDSSQKSDAQSKVNENQPQSSGGNTEQGNTAPLGSTVDKAEKKAASSGSQKGSVSPKKPGEYFMTLDEVFAIENISLTDKISGLSILSKLKKSEIEAVFNVAEDGITYGELDDIRHNLEKSLPEKDIEKLNEILEKNKKLYAEGKLAK